MASYNDMARTVLDFYTNPDQLVQYGGWEKVFDPNNTYSLEQAYEAIRNNPNIQVIERTDGTVVGWWNKSTGSGSLVNGVGSLPNSNTAGGSAASNALVNINTAPVVTQAPGSTTWKIANAPAVGEKWGTNGGVSGAILTVMAGIKLGLTFDAALYEVGKYTDIFTDEQLAALNPDNWKQIGSVVDEHWTEAGYPTIGKIGRYVFDTLTYVGQDYSSQTYVDDDAFTYAAQYLQLKKLFEIQTITDISSVPDDKLWHPGNYISASFVTSCATQNKTEYSTFTNYYKYEGRVIKGSAKLYVWALQGETSARYSASFYSTEPFTLENKSKVWTVYSGEPYYEPTDWTVTTSDATENVLKDGTKIYEVGPGAGWDCRRRLRRRSSRPRRR